MKKKSLFIISLIFFVTCIFNFQYVFAASGTRTDPASAWVNHSFIAQEYSWEDQKLTELQLIDYYSGTEANEIVANENMFNQVPAYDEEWIVMEFHLKYVAGPEDPMYASDIISSYYNFYTTSGVKISPLDTASFSDYYSGYGEYDVELYPGGESSVVYGILVKKTVGYPLVKLATGYDYSTDQSYYSWISTNPDSYKEVNVNTIGQGTVTGFGIYDNNDQAELTAIPSEGNLFKYWTNESGQIVSTNSTYSFAVTRDITLTANFEPAVRLASIRYRTHVQDIGWQDYVWDGAVSGTTGQGLRLEGINIEVMGNQQIGVQYSTHIQNIGWQDYVSNGDMSGTSGLGLRLEAIKINLTGTDASRYDLYYRVHAENFGWLDWAKNGQESGTAGFGYRLEGIQVRIVPAGSPAPGSTLRPFVKKEVVPVVTDRVQYRTHVQDYGWQGYVWDGAMSGTSGEGKRLEGINIKLGPDMPSGSIGYATHVQDYGWMANVYDGTLSGTTGEGKRLEGIRIALSGDVSTKYDVYYRVHAQEFGWLDWAKNGQDAGTAGFGYRLEGIEVQVLLKGSPAPGSTAKPFVSK